MNPRSAISDEAIASALYAAIVERRLPPGTKLGQDELGLIFGVSKSRIRPILFQLESRKLVTIEPNRGAFVATPSLEEARATNAVRQMLEEAMVRQLARGITAEQIATLRADIDEERRAHSEQQVGEAHRLTGEFHVRMARMHGNPVLEDMIALLVTRDSLAVALHQPFATDNSVSEHHGIVDALEQHDPDLAAARLLAHLQAVVDRLGAQPPSPPRSLAEVLRS